MVTPYLPSIALFAPLVGCILIVLFTLKQPKLSAYLAIGSLLASFVASLGLFALLIEHGVDVKAEQFVHWLYMPGLQIEFGFLINSLTVLMLLVVTGVGSAIFIYSMGYMADDPSPSRYFACLSLFAFSMLGIVLANNLITLFIFWELVGVSSYLLIGFWYEKPSAAEAGKKAFLVNRVADFGFLIGIILLWSLAGSTGEASSFNLVDLERHLHHLKEAGHLPVEALSVIGILLFCGVLGKSAQFPLHVWLPDAMEGPTPVSALIHAATMVAAGVFLLCRLFFLYADLPQVLGVIAAIGGFTSLFAATQAVVENDIKKILAYSTLSQLGYMVMALGLGGYTAGMFHLTTHAFFKALLFLGAGCVIHALHTNDIWKMGGLIKSMPVTGWTFMIGSLALCGIWPLAGFWSKDEILALALHQNPLLWAIGTLTALLTAFYMGRLLFVAFLSQEKSHHAHEAPWVMTFPLILLAVMSVIGGMIGIPQWAHHHSGVHVSFNPTVAFVSSIAAVGGLLGAWFFYGMYPELPQQLKTKFKPLYQLVVHHFYIDELYLFIVKYVQQSLAILCAWFERWVIMKLCVNGIALGVRATGATLKYLQTGKVQTYALFFFGGLIGLILLFKGSPLP